MPDITKDGLPVWLWAEIATPEFFAKMPKNLSFPKFAEAGSEPVAENEAVPCRPMPARQEFYFAEIKTHYCIDDDLSFCEGLAKAYSRMLEGRGEKIFLRGNSFIAKMAKAVFGQDANLFAEACGKYANEEYFRACAGCAEKWGFVFDGKFSKDSWRSLYDVLLLLTGEYLATKCELPRMDASECRGNGDDSGTLEIIVARQSTAESELGDACLILLDNSGLDDSSDDIKVGDLFYEFLGKNFPFKDDRDNFMEFMKEIYGDDVCGDLGWLYEDLSSNSLPRAEIKIDAIEGEGRLGSHEGETVCISQRLVLDAISSEKPYANFALLLMMLIEYGHFLSHALHGKANESAGKVFASWFMEYSEADLFNSDFEFADFKAPDAGGKEQKFTVKVSGLSWEERKRIFYELSSGKIWEWEV